MRMEDIFQGVLAGNASQTASLVGEALGNGHSPEDILYKGCIPAMEEVGRLFEKGEKFVPEMLISARAMQAGMEILKPALAQNETKMLGTVIIGTVAGDLHDIGKNLVAMMLSGTGFEVVDLGTDVSATQFVDAARAYQPDIICMSALLTTTMATIPQIVKALAEADLLQNSKVLIGGAPVTQEFAEQIGADGYAADASSASRIARVMVSDTNSLSPLIGR